jgi:hypothetical protein
LPCSRCVSRRKSCLYSQNPEDEGEGEQFQETPLEEERVTSYTFVAPILDDEGLISPAHLGPTELSPTFEGFEHPGVGQIASSSSIVTNDLNAGLHPHADLTSKAQWRVGWLPDMVAYNGVEPNNTSFDVDFGDVSFSLASAESAIDPLLGDNPSPGTVFASGPSDEDLANYCT